jgi:hypothetical protein
MAGGRGPAFALCEGPSVCGRLAPSLGGFCEALPVVGIFAVSVSRAAALFALEQRCLLQLTGACGTLSVCSQPQNACCWRVSRR